MLSFFIGKLTLELTLDFPLSRPKNFKVSSMSFVSWATWPGKESKAKQATPPKKNIRSGLYEHFVPQDL